jgi:hypothetical protein
MLNIKHNPSPCVLPAPQETDWWSAVLGPSVLPQASKTTLELLADRGIYPTKENTRSLKDRYAFPCPLPGHSNDRNPSFLVHSDGIRWKCFVCGLGGGPTKLRELLGGGLIPPMPRLPKAPKAAVKKVKARPSGCAVPPLAAAKSLPLDFLKSVMGWFDTDWYGTPAVGIDYGNGSLRYRVGLEGKDRFRWRNGSTPSLYWVDHLPEEAEYVLVCEGETDVAAATFLGIPAVGVPGVDTWKPGWAGRLAGKDVVLWQEPDQGGANLAAAMAEDIPGLRVIQAPPGIKDICELLDQASDGAGNMLRDLIEDALVYDSDINVPNRERANYTPFPIRDIQRKSQLWEAAKTYFPPEGKPWTVTRALYNHGDRKGVIAEFPSNSWRNAANAQLKRQRLFFNLLPRINGPQLYLLTVAIDDWTDKAHENIKKRINRAIEKADEAAGYGWAWFNNALSKGYYLYLTSAPGVSGFELLEGDVESLLVGALKGIHPPGEEDEGRFRPYGGSTNWTAKVEGTGEPDRDKWQIVAVSDSPADFVQFEAEAIAAGIHYKYTKPYWRQQIGMGLEIEMSFEEFMQVCTSLNYSPTQAGRLGLEECLPSHQGGELHE